MVDNVIDEGSISSDYLALLCEHATELGIPASTLLRNSGIPLRTILNSNSRVKSRSIDQVVQNFLEVQGPNLPIAHGKRMTIATHGMLGVATQTSETLYDAMLLVQQFINTRSLSGDRIEMLSDGDRTHIRLHSNDPVLSQGTIFFHVVAVLISIEYTSRWLYSSYQQTIFSQLNLTGDNSLSNYTQLLPEDFSIAFNQDHNELVWPTKMMKKPLVSSIPTINELAIQGCENELLRMTPGIDLSLSVRLMLRENSSPSLTADEVARQLHMSVSTMKRKLRGLDTSFQKIKDSERLKLAVDLLDNSDQNLEDISDQLGYNNSSNFIKAFKNWAGLSPSEYRLGHL